ncbi:alpha/beta hydrolase [Spirillospora sp. NBC_01491]|uniref:alpha/beta hydrolase n=1 Tax=Spirillospora sp. NBC_01491 TaxID=2976007 RepID=UPI002E31D77A|nr:alpha/beta hydrolase [Spirillospora sp. NBC_01491]
MLNAAGKSAAAGAVAAAVALGTVTAAAALDSGPAPRPSGAVSWTRCPDKDPLEKERLKGLDCANVQVPLDYRRPGGEKITLALTRARHTAARSQGVMLLNRGGPGAHGRDLPALFTNGMPPDVAAGYDWIGFDPRGVGASRPALSCGEKYQNPGRPRADTVPATAAAERAWRARAAAYSRDCGAKYRRVLPHMGSANWARDLDAIRAALGQDKINFFGYSYGTYLGAVYATMFPGRVRRMALDSVVRPSGVWYQDNLDQNVAFEKRIRTYFGWIARNARVYRLGRTRAEVGRSYAKVRAALAAKPLGGRVGPSELDDVFLADGYGDRDWAAHAGALSAFAVRHDPGPLRKAWQPPTWLDQNNYAVYNAVQCRDAAWPRDWKRWHDDSRRQYREGYRFETWSNAWYNAPCATWTVPGGPPPEVRGRAGLPPILLVQGTEDAATPYAGALEMSRTFPSARLVTQVGGGTHGITLGGDKCVDPVVAGYLRDGSLPRNRPGPDATCPASAPPKARPTKRNGRASGGGDRPVQEPVA